MRTSRGVKWETINKQTEKVSVQCRFARGVFGKIPLSLEIKPLYSVEVSLCHRAREAGKGEEESKRVTMER